MNHYYFDHNATTPVYPEVLEAVTQTLAEVPGNASSIHHFGQAAKQKLEEARREVAALLNADPGEIVFTAGGTESDNIAVFGTARVAGKHVITTPIEHPAVLQVCRQLEREGVAVSYVETGPGGVVDPAQIRRTLRPETALISVMYANNELGTVQPIEEIAAIAHEAGALFHSDGVQATGKIPVDVRALGVDLFSLSGHKLYAPKGVGALYVRKGTQVEPVLRGGRHERGLRPGTDNVPGAVGLGRAAAIASERIAEQSRRIAALRDRLEGLILDRVPGTHVNGRRDARVPNTTNIRFDGIAGEALVIALDLKGFAVSSGAACSSGAVEPSHVLTAIGLTAEEARASIRFSLGHSNTAEQVDALAEAVVESVAQLRKLSPTYA